jgi:hypothetical protein
MIIKTRVKKISYLMISLLTVRIFPRSFFGMPLFYYIFFQIPLTWNPGSAPEMKMKTTIVLHDVYCDATYLEYLHSYCFLDNNNRSGAVLTSSRTPGKAMHLGPYLTTHRNKTVNVYKIKHILTLERCRRGVYSVPSERMGTLGSFPGPWA